MIKKALTLVSIIILTVFSSYFIFKTYDIIYLNSNNLDTDGDGVPDKEDAFPNDSAASLDSDSDGYPDNWNIGKNQVDSNTNLSIDAFPDDPAASIDTDYDGYPNSWNPGRDQGDSTSIPPLEIDEFPDDPNDHKDTDKDGVGDYYDINDFVNLFINIKLEKFKVISRVDLLRWAQVYFVIKINGDIIKKIDNNGKFLNVWLYQEKKINHDQISYDIPDNTENQFTEIEIIMYDHDFFGDDDVIDISDKANEETLVLNFDNIANTISQNGVTKGSKGILWYNISYVESNISETENYDRTYRWKFNNKQWKFSLEIPADLYNQYVNSKIKRNPYADKDMLKFVTSDDKIISNLSDNLLSISGNENYDSVTTINFILRFVQENVEYIYDNISKGVAEYWRYPIETLVEKKGDCEDSSVLFASILDNLNYDVALLFYTWSEGDQNFGHLAVGIHLDGDHGSYVEDNTGKRYYYCETTSSQFVIGQLPPEIKDKPDKIINI